MKTITLPFNALKAARLFVAAKDVRFYLNGVLLRIKDGQSALVATNGNSLAAIEAGVTDYLDGQWIIPNAAVDALAKKSSGSVVELTFFEEGDRFELGCYVGKFLDGKFPDFMRVIPAGDVAPDNFQYDPELLMPFKKAAKILDGSTQVRVMPIMNEIGTGGKKYSRGVARVDIGVAGFVGVIMPWVDKKSWASNYEIPGWLK